MERFSKVGREQGNGLTSGLLLSHAERARLNVSTAAASATSNAEVRQ
jgi:hypothetical protein